ncbi:uncharacterized protein LOC144135288 [Amblyomma americanum]
MAVIFCLLLLGFTGLVTYTVWTTIDDADTLDIDDVDGDKATQITYRSVQGTPTPRVAPSTQSEHQDTTLSRSSTLSVGEDTTSSGPGILTTLPTDPGSNGGGDVPAPPVSPHLFPPQPSVLRLRPSAEHLAWSKATRPPSA